MEHADPIIIINRNKYPTNDYDSEDDYEKYVSDDDTPKPMPIPAKNAIRNMDNVNAKNAIRRRQNIEEHSDEDEPFDEASDDDDIDNNAVNTVEEYTDDDKEKMFWNIVAGFQWVNRTDMIVNPGIIERRLKSLSTLHKDIFSDVYPRIISNVRALLIDKLETADIKDETRIGSVCSHLVMLGLEWYTSVTDGNDIIDFIFIMNEDQDFHTIITEVYPEWFGLRGDN